MYDTNIVSFFCDTYYSSVSLCVLPACIVSCAAFGVINDDDDDDDDYALTVFCKTVISITRCAGGRHNIPRPLQVDL